MVRSELLQKFCNQNPQLARKDLKEILEIIFDQISEALSRGDDCEFRNFGNFRTIKRKARIGDKIIGELYFNLAYAHFILRDWENVYKKLSKANESKGLKRVTKNFDLKAKSLEKRYKSNASVN